MLIGIPAKLLPQVVKSLEVLSQKAMQTVSEKGVYLLYRKELERK
jgi:hypothetical protein